jgi:hypothetical protein
VIVRSAGADTRPRKEGRGRQSARSHTHEGGREGKEKGGGDGAPFICNTTGGRVGDRLQVAPRGGEAWGGGVGASTVVGRRGVAGSSPAVALAGGV